MEVELAVEVVSGIDAIGKDRLLDRFSYAIMWTILSHCTGERPWLLANGTPGSMPTDDFIFDPKEGTD